MAVNWVGGTSNTAASSAAITATYSPTAGNLVLLLVATGGSASAMSVQDNNGNYLISGNVGGSSSVPVAGGTGYMWMFWGIAQAGATSFTVNWTTSQVSSLVLGEYSGVGGFYWVAASSPWTVTGTSITPSSTITTTDANVWLVGGLLNNSTTAFSSFAGTNLRENSGTARTAVCCLVDSGAVAVNTAQLVKATLAGSVAWGGLFIELRPYAGGQYVSGNNPSGATANPTLYPVALAPYGAGGLRNTNSAAGALYSGWGVSFGNVYRPGQTFP